MKKVDFLIVGSGLFGATFARVMTDRGYKCRIVEKRDAVGGNCRTQMQHGIPVHLYGAHIFHTSNAKVWNFVNSLCEFNGFINSPLANYGGKLYHLPFNMNTFYALFGTKTPNEAREVIESQIRQEDLGEIDNLEKKALSMVGRTIYETLVKGYTEKQWGKDCKALPPFIIGRLPLRFTYNDNYFSDRYQGIPVGGYEKLFDALLEGIEVETGVNYFDDKEALDNSANHIIFTGRIDDYFGNKYGELEYRSLRFESETLDMEDFQGNAVVNYTEYGVPYTRIIEHKHFDDTCKSDCTVITREYPQAYSEGLEPYYTVNDEKNNTLYKKYKADADAIENVSFGGRLADYKYYDMDDTIEAAFALCDTLDKKRKNRGRHEKI